MEQCVSTIMVTAGCETDFKLARETRSGDMGTLYCLLTPVHKRKKQHATLKIMLGKLEIQRTIYCKKNCFCEADKWRREKKTNKYECK